MTVFHEIITEFDPEADDENEQIINHVDRFREIISSVGDAQIMIISLVGPYQTGKSSLITLLTRDSQIQVGDGVNETTQGAFLYGPYDYNSIRSHFGLQPSRSLKLFFIDTEGICGYRISNHPILNQLLLTHILAPYVSLSQINIVMHRSQIESGTASYLNNFFEVVNQIIDGDSLLVLDVIPGQQFLNPNRTLTTEQQYREAVKVLENVIPNRMTNVKVTKFIPTSQYNVDYLPLEQTPKFFERFNFAARDILESIDEAQKLHQYDSQGIIQQFGYLLDNMKNLYDLHSLVKEARMQGELTTAERIYLPMVKQLIEKKNADITKQFPDTSNPSLYTKEDDLELSKNANLAPILESAFDELERYEMTPTIREHCLPKFRTIIEHSLTDTFNLLQQQYIVDITKMQLDFLLKKIKNKAEEEFAQANILLNKTTTSESSGGPIEAFNSHTRAFTNRLLKKYIPKFTLSDYAVDMINEQVNTILSKCNEILFGNANSIKDQLYQRECLRQQEKEQIYSIIRSAGEGFFGGLGALCQAVLNNPDSACRLASFALDARRRRQNPAISSNSSNQTTIDTTTFPPPKSEEQTKQIEENIEPPKPPETIFKSDEPTIKTEFPSFNTNQETSQSIHIEQCAFPPPPTPLTSPPSPPSPPSPTQGQKVDLNKAKIYTSSTSDKPALASFSGTKYVQDGKVVNGRVRITGADNVGKPAGKTTFGWMDVSDIHT